MRLLFLCICLFFISSPTWAQQDTSLPGLAPSSADIYRTADSLVSENSRKQMNETLNYLVAEKKKRDKKLQQQSIIRIAFGLLMLIVLIIGIRRNSRKKKKTG